MTCISSSPLSTSSWTARAKKHAAMVTPYADAFLERRNHGLIHPVHDFLFTYYSFAPGKLKQWVPSFEEELIADSETRQEYPWMHEYWFKIENNILSLNSARINEKTRGLAQFIAELCGNISERPPRFTCFGLHEWAMVHKLPSDAIRHNKYRLRLSPEALAEFVENQKICCSHYDAFRFFTDDARPLNLLNPTLETRLQMEQGGCVHANMDLYKWATKLWPWIGSDFIAKAFLLAVEGRELDMRASPYDLADAGFEPICIETEEGRQQYQQEQRRLTARAMPLRTELRAFCQRLLQLPMQKR